MPDPEGELYDDWVRMSREAEQRALEQASRSRWGGSPAQLEAQDAMAMTPPNPLGVKLVPILGPLFDATNDLRTDKPWSAAGNGLMALTDLGLVITGAGVASAVDKGVANNVGRRTAEAARKQLRRRGVAGPGQEIHHSAPLNGRSRSVENWRNHPAFLKVLEIEKHRRQSGRWQGLPKYDPIRRVWIGTPTWMKTVPAWVGAHAAALGAPIASAMSDQRSNPGLPPPLP